MLSAQGLNAYFRLQQILLASEDSKSVLNFLLPQILLQFLSIGVKYDFVDVLFISADQSSSKAQVVGQSYYADSRFLTTKVDLPPTVINAELLLDARNDWEKELLWGRTFVTTDLSLLSKPIQGIKVLVLSPMMRSNELIGVLSFGTQRALDELSEEERDLIILVTNLVNYAFKIQDVERSLSDVTQEIYKMNSKLHDLDKLKDDFVSIASHELSTPLHGSWK